MGKNINNKWENSIETYDKPLGKLFHKKWPLSFLTKDENRHNNIYNDGITQPLGIYYKHF